MKVIVAVIIGLIAVGAGALGTGTGPAPLFATLGATPALAQKTKTQVLEGDRGTYFRLKVNLTYKGEPANFDIVVGCRVRITHQIDRDRSVEVGIAPMVYGLKMKDGAGVVVRPPEACRGETTANGEVPADLLPFVIVFPDADSPTSGMGYVSEDAYESRLSVLKFGGAAIENATRQDFEAWRAENAGKNIVKPEMISFNLSNPFKPLPWRPGMKLFGHWCTGIIRLGLPQEVADAMQRFWPTDHPRFWFPHGDSRTELLRLVGNSASGTGIPFEGHHYHAYSSEGLVQYGLPRRSGNGMVLYKKAAAAVFPGRTPLSLNNVGEDGSLPPAIASERPRTIVDYDVRPEFRGFVYCDAQASASYSGAPVLFRLTDPYIYRVNGEGIIELIPGRTYSTSSGYVFLEKLEAAYKDLSLGTTSLFGGL